MAVAVPEVVTSAAAKAQAEILVLAVRPAAEVSQYLQATRLQFMRVAAVQVVAARLVAIAVGIAPLVVEVALVIMVAVAVPVVKATTTASLPRAAVVVEALQFL